MGYDLHITRKESWSDDEDKNIISFKEWKEYVSKNSNIYEDPENDEYSFLYFLVSYFQNSNELEE